MRRSSLALLAISFSLAAADETYVLKAAHMFDGKSDHVVSPGLVVVTSGRITVACPDDPEENIRQVEKTL